ARQHRCRGRWYECVARSFQYPGADRRRAAVRAHARLSHAPPRLRADVRRLHEDAAVQADASEPDELLAELSQVLRKLPEVYLRRCCNCRKQLGLRLVAEA